MDMINEIKICSRVEIASWQLPNFQRPLRTNDKVKALSAEIKHNGGIMHGGPFTLGRVDGDPIIYLVDGQHRREAFLITDLEECLIEVRIRRFPDQAAMSRSFVEINTKLVTMRPDDVLRALEEYKPLLQKIRAHCPFVGYTNIRRGGKFESALLSMSVLLRTWKHASYDTPPVSGSGGSAQDLAENLELEEVNKMIPFLLVAREAWGDHPENYRLWAGGNLVLVMWLWRHLVSDYVPEGRGHKARRITITEFRNGMIALSRDAVYMQRILYSTLRSDRDKSVLYNSMKAIFARRLSEDTTEKVRLPEPPWAAR